MSKKSFGLVDYLGPDSYYGVLDAINQKIFESREKTTSLSTKKLFESTMEELNNSLLPMMAVKKFMTNAEQMQNRDATVLDVMEFIKTKSKSGDFNFLINLVKEEHLENTNRAGIPNAIDTIKSLQEMFDEPSSIVEEAIKNGIFDTMQSNLLNTLKSNLNGLDLSKNKIADDSPSIDQLFENNNFVGSLSNNLMMYTPIGLKIEDIKNNRQILLFENDCVTFDRVTKTFKPLMEENIDDVVPQEHKNLMRAITEMSYNPTTEVFTLNENWDFDLELNMRNNTIMLGGDLFPKEDVVSLLTESIEHYHKTIPLFGNKEAAFLRDADNFIAIMENMKSVIRFDNLRTIRNINESNNYVILHHAQSEGDTKQWYPTLVGSSEGNKAGFASYTQMFESVNEILGVKNHIGLNKLFESCLNEESQIMKEINKTQQQLIAEQSQLNKMMVDLQEAKKVADVGSPVYLSIQKRIDETQKLIDDNIANTIQLKGNQIVAP